MATALGTGDSRLFGGIKDSTAATVASQRGGTFRTNFALVETAGKPATVQVSVFFADGGIAFHEGGQDTYSAGCVKLVHDNAVAWFAFLKVGDQVQIK